MDNQLKRIKYSKSPLVEVVFQLRFPTILSINSTQPFFFQDKIRDRYPFFEDQLEEYGDVVLDTQLKKAAMRKMGENKNYSFISTDHMKKINLTPSFISFSSMAYEQWEIFREDIEGIIPIFEEIYRPIFYTRIGLRYIDVITRSKLDLINVKWTELIKSHVLGMITEEHEDGVNNYISETEYKTKVNDVLSKTHFELVQMNDQSEISFLIDCDYYILKTIKIEQVKEKSEALHDASSHFIQSAITNRLHNAMGPTEI